QSSSSPSLAERKISLFTVMAVSMRYSSSPNEAVKQLMFTDREEDFTVMAVSMRYSSSPNEAVKQLSFTGREVDVTVMAVSMR
ncbi:hypothetical protein AKJ16_DCAP26580, partial [Drosera capensis]